MRVSSTRVNIVSLKIFIKDALEFCAPWLPPIIGGAIDYANEVQRGKKKWNGLGFLIHLASAAFFGWVIGGITAGFGYNANIIAAAGGMGGFFGVRIADFTVYAIAQRTGTKK